MRVRAHMLVHAHLFVRACWRVCMFACVRTRACQCAHVGVRAHVCVHVHVSVRVLVCPTQGCVPAAVVVSVPVGGVIAPTCTAPALIGYDGLIE